MLVNVKLDVSWYKRLPSKVTDFIDLFYLECHGQKEVLVLWIVRNSIGWLNLIKIVLEFVTEKKKTKHEKQMFPGTVFDLNVTWALQGF